MNTENSIIKNNVLIAKFMGAKVKDNQYYFPYIIFRTGKNFFNAEELLFNNHWNWLMVVIDKIKEIGVGEYTLLDTIDDNLIQIELEATYNAVVQFIKWYNENK